MKIKIEGSQSKTIKRHNEKEDNKKTSNNNVLSTGIDSIN